MASRTRASANSSSTSFASGSCSTPNPPEPTSRDRKAARPPKRVPGGAVDEAPRARCEDPAPDALRRGLEQFNAGEFFEQHETLETLWRDTRTPIRGLYHGILQIGVGFHHWRNGNHHGASVLLEEGIGRLRPFSPSCQGVDVATLIRDATVAREELLRLGPEGMKSYDLARAPKVRLAQAR
jgi:predicted transcriptional regulator